MILEYANLEKETEIHHSQGFFCRIYNSKYAVSCLVVGQNAAWLEWQV